MKKLMTFFTALCLVITAGCSGGGQGETPAPEISAPGEEAGAVRIGALKGPTTMGMVKLMEEDENGELEQDYEFTVATTDEIVPKISKGELDIAAIPANLASVLYNNTEGNVMVAAINTLGVLYVVEKGETVQSVSDLEDKTILSTGKGATPEFSLNYVLEKNGILPGSDITVEYKSEAAEIIPLLSQMEEGIAMLPQPFVTTALEKIPGLRIALDWTQQWDEVSEDGSSLVTGVVVVSKKFAEENPEALEIFAKEYKQSTEFVTENPDAAGELVGKYGIVDAEIAKKAIPYCNITYISGAEMQAKLSGYLNALYTQEPASVGGSLPDESFYFIPA